MGRPIELFRGRERRTVYNERKANALADEGWRRVSDLPQEEQEDLQNQPLMPWDGYEDMTVEQVLDHATTLSVEQHGAIVAYEQSRPRPRKGIVEGLANEVE